MAVAQDNVQIKMERGASVSTLEVDIEIPTAASGIRPAA
jgi:cell division topological specificity factor